MPHKKILEACFALVFLTIGLGFQSEKPNLKSVYELPERQYCETSSTLHAGECGLSTKCYNTPHCRQETNYMCGNYCCCCQIDGSGKLVANCSGYGEHLGYIPQLPENVTYLDFSGNVLDEMTNLTFHNVTHVPSIDLSHTRLKLLGEGVLDNVRFRCIIMKDNFDFDISKYGREIFKLTTLQEVYLDNAYVVFLPEDMFSTSYNLRKLSMKNVNMRTWNATIFQELDNLTVLELSGNDMRYIDVSNTSSFESLIKLNLVSNDLNSFPQSCGQSYPFLPIYPSLQKLNLSRNTIVAVSSTNLCFPSLRVLDISWNPISELITGVFGFQNFPNLHCLFMQRLELYTIEAFAFNNTSVWYLSLMYNYIDFVTENIDENSFVGLDNVCLLQLEQNYLNNEMFLRLFGHMSKLQYLFIGNTYYDFLTTDTFAPFPELIGVTLHRNFFWVIPDGVFDGLPYLTHLDLSNCRVSTVSENTFSSALRRRLIHLDLSGFFFRCDCDLLWFQSWMVSHAHVFNSSWAPYQCQNLPGVNVTDFQINPQVCLMSRETSVFTVVVVTMLMMILAIVATIFRYRWSIRLLLYEAFRGKGRSSLLPADHFRYDVFVSYAEEDLSFVRRHLMRVVERGWGLRLCIHQRDFTPGENIVDNIYCSVQNSRKVLMVFSTHFARSQWCQFELAMCLNHVIENGDALVVTCVDDVSCSGEMTPTMMAVLNTTTYIQWAEEDDARAAFWGRIRMALDDVTPRGNRVHAI